MFPLSSDDAGDDQPAGGVDKADEIDRFSSGDRDWESFDAGGHDVVCAE